MNGRRRFAETMAYGSPDRVPYLEEGLRDDSDRLPGHWQAQSSAGKREHALALSIHRGFFPDHGVGAGVSSRKYSGWRKTTPW